MRVTTVVISNYASVTSKQTNVWMPFVKHGVLSERIDSIAFALYFDFNIDFVLGYFQLLLKKQKVQRHNCGRNWERDGAMAATCLWPERRFATKEWQRTSWCDEHAIGTTMMKSTLFNFLGAFVNDIVWRLHREYFLYDSSCVSPEVLRIVLLVRQHQFLALFHSGRHIWMLFHHWGVLTTCNMDYNLFEVLNFYCNATFFLVMRSHIWTG